MSTVRRVCVLGRICVPFASRIISEETVKRASGDFQLRSDPLLLAQIAGGKHNGLRPISMSTAAWSGACISERSYANGESAATSELISSLRGAWCTRAAWSLFASVPSNLSRVHLCPGVNSYEKSRRRIGNVVQPERARWPRDAGTGKSTGGKTTEEKTDWQIRSFRANNYRINYSARSALSSTLFTRAHTYAHTCTCTHTIKERPRLSISGGTWVRLIREADPTARTRVRRVTSPARTPAPPSNSLLRSS